MTSSSPAPSNQSRPSRIRLPSAGCLFVISLFFILAAVCILIGWPVHRQQARLQYFERLEARVETIPAGPVWLRDLAAVRFGDDYAAGFTEITWLVLDECSVTDAGLDLLNGCTELRGLCLANTRISDAGMRHLGGLRSLEVLSLYNTDVSDAGLRHVGGLTNLRQLYLSRTRVTDAGLPHLYDLGSLDELWLQRTDVTDAGVRELQSHRPDCEIKVSTSPM